MEFQVWAAFAAASLVMAVIPGPGVASIVGFALNSGQRVALASVGGMAVGNALAMTVSLAGAGAILAASALAFSILKWAGALYLVAIGVIALRRSAEAGPVSTARRPISARTAFMTNVAVGSFHPKTILFFVAFAAQFISPAASYLPQAALLVATFTGIAMATDTIYALTASRASGAMLNPRVRRWSQRAGGSVLIAAGVATALIRR